MQGIFAVLFGAVGAAFAVEHIQTVRYRVNDCQDIFLGSLLAAGQGDDEAALANTCHAAAEAALGGDPHGFCPHGFGNAGGGTLNDVHGGFGGDVSGREAGAAGGQHQGDTHQPFLFHLRTQILSLLQILL